MLLLFSITIVQAQDKNNNWQLSFGVNAVDLDAVAMALKGMDQAITDKVLGVLPKKKQAMFEPVEGAVPKRDVDTARKSVVSAAKQMEKDGTKS